MSPPRLKANAWASTRGLGEDWFAGRGMDVFESQSQAERNGSFHVIASKAPLHTKWLGLTEFPTNKERVSLDERVLSTLETDTAGVQPGLPDRPYTQKYPATPRQDGPGMLRLKSSPCTSSAPSSAPARGFQGLSDFVKVFQQYSGSFSFSAVFWESPNQSNRPEPYTMTEPLANLRRLESASSHRARSDEATVSLRFVTSSNLPPNASQGIILFAAKERPRCVFGARLPSARWSPFSARALPRAPAAPAPLPGSDVA